MLIANVSQKASSNCDARRDRGPRLQRVASQHRMPTVYRRMGTAVTLLSLLTFIAVSGPHRVHHLLDSIPSPEPSVHDGLHAHDHGHEHAAHPGQPTEHPQTLPTSSPDCVVLFLLQSLPLHGAACTSVSAPIELQPLDGLAQWIRPLEPHISLSWARAPPLVSYFS